MNLKVLIADDELLARKRIRRLLEETDGVEIVGECEDGKSVLKTLKDTSVDVVLLDIQMPGLTGIETLELMDAAGPQVVFTTAYSEYAVKAFEEGAVDYLLKPIESDRLSKALDRVRERAAEPKMVQGLTKLPIPTRRGLVLVDPAKVGAAMIDGESVTVYVSGEDYITDFRIAELERRLPKEMFLRVHRKALVNLDHIERLEPEPTGGYTAHMRDGLQVPVSRQSARGLRKLWDLPR